ncbi:hypothetical protein ACLBXM_02840 [Xanthobacteraceae bacterium A53D]
MDKLRPAKKVRSPDAPASPPVKFSVVGKQPNDLVPTQAASVHDGQITEQIAREIGRTAAPIRLQVGDENYGFRHIERKGKEITERGFLDARAFVERVAQNYDCIYAASGRRLMLLKLTDNPYAVMVVELNPQPTATPTPSRLTILSATRSSKTRNCSGEVRRPTSSFPNPLARSRARAAIELYPAGH